MSNPTCWRSECRNGCYYPAACNETPETKCIGFVECPCLKCRRTRLEATESHPDHGPGQSAYCGACRTAERARYAAPARPLVWRRGRWVSQ